MLVKRQRPTWSLVPLYTCIDTLVSILPSYTPHAVPNMYKHSPGRNIRAGAVAKNNPGKGPPLSVDVERMGGKYAISVEPGKIRAVASSSSSSSSSSSTNMCSSSAVATRPVTLTPRSSVTISGPENNREKKTTLDKYLHLVSPFKSLTKHWSLTKHS